MLRLLTECNDPSDRTSYTPGHLTVGAFVLGESGVVMIHHRKLGIWIEPGGHIDPSDVTLEAAAARELLEETAIAAAVVGAGIFDIDVHDIPATDSEPAHKHFNVSYLFAPVSGDLTPADEVLDARWVKLADVSELTTDGAVERAIEKLKLL